MQPTLPRGLAVSVARRAASAAKPRPKPRAPAGPCNGKQMAGPLTAGGCSRQSRRGNFSFAVIHHRAGSGKERGRKDRVMPDTGRLACFKSLLMAHSWLPLTHTCKNTSVSAYTRRDGPCSHPCTGTHACSGEYILAHAPASCLSLVVLFFSAPTRH